MEGRDEKGKGYKRRESNENRGWRNQERDTGAIKN